MKTKSRSANYLHIIVGKKRVMVEMARHWYQNVGEKDGITLWRGFKSWLASQKVGRNEKRMNGEKMWVLFVKKGFIMHFM